MSAEKRTRKPRTNVTGHQGRKRATDADSPKPEAGQLPDSSPIRHEWVAVAAYYRAECRGFAPGCEHDDWFEAEQEIDKRLSE